MIAEGLFISAQTEVSSNASQKMLAVHQKQHNTKKIPSENSTLVSP
jgi:hypothetical protein